ncbi:MAG: hypothetical protein JW745_07170, partial [Sedimentisphaerales bacterium]|nr:hypothetical protein [Sedimentisphaerales bacterium]
MISSECKFGNNSSEASNITRCFLESMFALLNERQMQYVVLRNYEDLPDVVDNDVDLLVASGNMKQVEAELAILARQSGFLLLRKVRRFRYVSFWYLLPGIAEVLHLDIWTAIDIKGIRWIDEKEIFARRKPYKQFFVPQDYSLALML